MIFIVVSEIAACVGGFISFYFNRTFENLALLIVFFSVLIITVAVHWYKLDKSSKDIKKENEQLKKDLGQFEITYRQLLMDKESSDQKLDHFEKHRNERIVEADKKLYREVLKRIPHDHKLILWFKEKNLGERNIDFDYFDIVFRFKYDFARNDIFFHDEQLEILFQNLLKDIEAFEKLCGQYMGPSKNGEGYDIARHTDRSSYDPTLDALERKRMEEINNSASQVYKSFESFYKNCRKILVV